MYYINQRSDFRRKRYTTVSTPSIQEVQFCYAVGSGTNQIADFAIFLALICYVCFHFIV